MGQYKPTQDGPKRTPRDKGIAGKDKSDVLKRMHFNT